MCCNDLAWELAKIVGVFFPNKRLLLKDFFFPVYCYPNTTHVLLFPPSCPPHLHFCYFIMDLKDI